MKDQSISNNKTLRDQLSSLRKLAQPFFLPLEQSSGWNFIWLLISLLFCVGGIVLILITGLIQFLENIQPILLAKYFGGVQGTINSIWSSWWGLFFSVII